MSPTSVETPPAFWGWRMVMAGTVVMIVSSGVGFYGWVVRRGG